jgi:integral membrane protein
VSTPQPTGTSPISISDPGIRSALLRYRVIAYVVGVMLLLLVFLAMPVKYLADNPGPMNVIGPLHGFLYVVYLLATFDLGRRARFGLGKMVLVALAGTIPFLSFVAERRISHQLERTE